MNQYSSPPPPPPPQPPRTSALAITSMILGLFSLVCGILLGLPAVICGHIAHSRIKRSGGALTGGGLAITGLITGYVSFLVTLMLLAIAIPNFVKAREVAQTNTCRNHLRQIDGIKNQWAIENSKVENDTPTEAELTVYLGGEPFPTCPNGGSYSINSMSEAPTCTVPNHQLDIE